MVAVTPASSGSPLVRVAGAAHMIPDGATDGEERLGVLVDQRTQKPGLLMESLVGKPS